mmetsp:Transcript_12355/g.23281  ORF Transcript_12355/g.23281 Transcript_12355/m.23281 type:complete len:89 (-) Transcript_12355:39-305(-)
MRMAALSEVSFMVLALQGTSYFSSVKSSTIGLGLPAKLATVASTNEKKKDAPRSMGRTSFFPASPSRPRRQGGPTSSARHPPPPPLFR